MKSALLFAFAFGAALVPSVTLAQTPTPQGSPSSMRVAPRSQDFVSYAFGKINPGNRDYGSAVDAARNSVVSYTIDDVYFWSNCISITLLAGVSGLFLLQLRSSDKKERIASALIAQLFNGRVSDKIEIERRTEEHNLLVNMHNQIVEASLGSPTVQQKTIPSIRESEPHETPRIEIQPAAKPGAKSEASLVSSPSPIHGLGHMKRAGALAPASVQLSVGTSPSPEPAPEADRNKQEFAYTQEIQRLKSQVDAYQNVEKNLKQRLNAQQEYIERFKTSGVAGPKNLEGGTREEVRI